MRDERARIGLHAFNAVHFAANATVVLAAPKTIDPWKAAATVEQKRSVQANYSENQL